METNQKTIGIIGGSGLAQGLEQLLKGIEKKEHVHNEMGEVLSYYEGIYRGLRVIILPRHGDAKDQPSRSPAELVRQRGYEANIWQLYNLGVSAVYGLSAVGALDLETPLADTGFFIIPNTYIRGCAASQHSFGIHAKNVHTNMEVPFNSNLRVIARGAIHDAGCHARDNGTYIYNGGDAFETPAEIRMLDRLTKGETTRIVGMTTIPEVILCAQMGIPFAAICSNVNYAEGLSQATMVSHEQTLSVMEKASKYLTTIAGRIINIHSLQ